MAIDTLKKKLQFGACALGFVAILGAGIGYRTKCPSGLYATTNTTVALVAWIVGADLCR